MPPKRTERLGEYRSLVLRGVELSARDVNFLKREEVAKAIRVSRTLDGALEVSSVDAVGVLELETIRIEVEPKLAGGRDSLARMLDLLLPRPDTIARNRDVEFEGDHLLDLVIAMLCHEADLVVRRGILHDYRHRVESTTAVRGRILVDRQLTKRFGRWDRVWCGWNSFGTLAAENMRVRDALDRATRVASNPQVRTSARRLAGVFDEACEGVVDPGFSGPIQTHRQNAYYWPTIPQPILSWPGPHCWTCTRAAMGSSSASSWE